MPTKCSGLFIRRTWCMFLKCFCIYKFTFCWKHTSVFELWLGWTAVVLAIASAPGFCSLVYHQSFLMLKVRIHSAWRCHHLKMGMVFTRSRDFLSPQRGSNLGLKVKFWFNWQGHPFSDLKEAFHQVCFTSDIAFGKHIFITSHQHKLMFVVGRKC